MKEHKKIERLILFGQVAKFLSFSKAAEHMEISKGHLSEQVKMLEQELGINLLTRSTRQVGLTVEGKKVLDCIDLVKHSVNVLEQDIRHGKSELKGELTITAPKQFSHRFLTPLCHQFHQLHPDIRFNIDTSYISHDLNSGHFDVAFRSTNTPPLDMVAKPILHYRHLYVASPEYINQYGRPKTPADLNQHQCLYAPEQNEWSFKSKKVKVSGWLTLNDNFLLREHAIEGRGIARFPEYFVDEAIKEQQLICLFEEECINKSRIFAIHPPRIKQSARLRAFLNHVTQSLTSKT